jgi:ApbE superfamily uncharacterized protein (UPF0280 family)
VVIATHSTLADSLATTIINLKDGKIIDEVGNRNAEGGKERGWEAGKVRR